MSFWGKIPIHGGQSLNQFPLLDGGEIDRRLSLRPGSAIRLAKRDKIPYVVLPGGAIRFNWPDVLKALTRVPTNMDCEESNP